MCHDELDQDLGKKELPAVTISSEKANQKNKKVQNPACSMGPCV